MNLTLGEDGKVKKLTVQCTGDAADRKEGTTADLCCLLKSFTFQGGWTHAETKCSQSCY